MDLNIILPEDINLNIYNNYLSIYDKKLLNKKNYSIYLNVINNNTKKIQKLYKLYKLKINIHMIYNINIKYIRRYYIIKYPQELKIKYIKLAGNKRNKVQIKLLYIDLIYKINNWYLINNKYYNNINNLVNTYFIRCINLLSKDDIEYIGW